MSDKNTSVASANTWLLWCILLVVCASSPGGRALLASPVVDILLTGGLVVGGLGLLLVCSMLDMRGAPGPDDPPPVPLICPRGRLDWGIILGGLLLLGLALLYTHYYP